MQQGQVPQPPADVEEQTLHIVQSGIAERVYPELVVKGHLDELLLWAGFQQEACCTLLSLFAQRRDGGTGSGVVLQSALYVARNHLGNPEGWVRDALDFPRLQLLERLAIGPEEFNLMPGQQYMRTHEQLPAYEGRHIAVGDVLVVESVYFTRVNFVGDYRVPRNLVCGTYFRFCA